VRNLPAAFASATFHPPVAPARAVPNLQDDPEESRIDRGTVLALARVAEGGRVVGVEPNTTVGLLVDVLGPALADRPPMPSLDLRPRDLELVAVGAQDAEAHVGQHAARSEMDALQGYALTRRVSEQRHAPAEHNGHHLHDDLV
jgi:hypothetical protein